ncbi:MAG: transcriptional repressor [Bacteroidota bacterium]|nr:transcriptional repressor [Candidatus Kapabacteria bacterium]MCS7303208.1 transcriptional repressor [Candidatus Kapabacteria bacterium]MCX7936728.1 transcriptional repressor [Chlorobiota bacterium]MDW8074228.1 transcriptional repressor [Bacteroidota bacterium]MDW8271296.1 transcriptional repressor [Bacteroidota bacterium]
MKHREIDVEKLREQFREFLRTKMYRNTQERFRVLERAAELDRHFTADELYLYMNQRGDKISRATVYSTLDLLTRCNIVTKHRFQGDSATYELTARKPNHDHLICRDCGYMVEFQDSALVVLQDEIARRYGMRALSHAFQIFATCDDSNCQRRLHEQSPTENA